jgi:hypothetical protein
MLTSLRETPGPYGPLPDIQCQVFWRCQLFWQVQNVFEASATRGSRRAAKTALPAKTPLA